MSWHSVAYKDVNDASRSRGLWALFVLLAVLSVGYTFAHTYLGESTFHAFLGGLAGVVGVTLPPLALLVGYKSVIHERTSGSLFLTLSFPHSRRDFLAGKLLGRSAVLLGPTLVALTIAGAIGAVRYGTDGVVLFPWFLLATALYGLAFVGLAIGFSMATTVNRWVTLGALGAYFILVTFWGGLHSMILVILHRFDVSVLSNMPDWALLFRLVGPNEAYDRLLRAGFDVDLATRYAADGAPVYVDWWMGIVVLVVWFAVPLVVGFRRFGSADL